jgi:CRISPR-associated protein Cas5h
MRAISFKLSGKTACFRKPDVNVYSYFTYNNIHRIALLGLLGAIVGLGGYTQLYNENRDKKKAKKQLNDSYPEFYEKLKHLKLSITPLAQNGYFSKKIQTFNNSVGYASFEVGGNLIIREQWLENPSWQIMILEDESEEFKKISDYLMNAKSIFIPYLGKNDHFADIFDVEFIELYMPNHNYIDSLFIKNFDKIDSFAKENEAPFIFQEVTPMRFQKDWHFYEYETVIFTNYEIDNLPNDTFMFNGKNYVFV